MALIIKSLSVDPPNFDDLSDDEDDFVKDPAQYRDQLPQPYRYIDALLGLLIDDIWENITARENERIAEKSKFRPPKYECITHLQEISNAKAMTSSDDGRYMFAGFPGGIWLVNAATRKIIASFDDERLDIINIKCTIIGVEIYLLTTIDEQGVCRLFGCTAENLFLIKIVNEDSNMINHIAVKCETSSDGDYLGLVVENPNSGETMFEVHQLPRDIWNKEIEELKVKFIRDEKTEPVQSIVVVHPDLKDPITEEISETQTQQDESADLIEGETTKSVESTGSKKGGPIYKFSPTTLVMKQNTPPKVMPNVGPSPSATLSNFPDARSVIGSGQNNTLTKQYLEVRNEAFKQLHSQKLQYKLEEESDRSVECHFHFFTPGMMIPYGIEQPGAMKKPTSVGVWWSGSRQFSLYCLTRPIKVRKQEQPGEELFLKAESVWPQADFITASATSPDSSLVAIGLKNGLVTIWDKHLAVARKTMKISKTAIAALDFVDPVVCPQHNNRTQCYPTSTSCYVLIRSADSALNILNCGMLDINPPITLTPPADNDDSKITQTMLFPSRLPEIFLRVHKGGKMFIQDVQTMDTICELALPTPYQLSTPWNPVISLSAYGQILYVQGVQTVSEETESEQEAKQTTSIHSYQLRSFPTLDKYWTRVRTTTPYISPTPIEQRVNSLLTHRIKSSGRRQQRLQERWPLMKQELSRIMTMKTH